MSEATTILTIHGAETVTYSPDGGDDREILAVVRRLPADASGAGGVGPHIEITVANSASEGIAASEVDRGRDRVTLARVLGGDPSERVIFQILEQDSVFLKLEIR